MLPECRKGNARRAIVALSVAVASFAVTAPASAAPQWLAPVDLAGPSATYMGGDLAVAADGSTLVVFTEIIDGFSRVRARLRRPGGGFGDTFELSPPGRRADSPSVAADRQGNFTVAWTVLGTPGGVQAARLPAGSNAFEATQTVSSASECLPFPNVVAVGANGTAVIVFKTRGCVSSAHSFLKAAIRTGAQGRFDEPTTISAADPSDYSVAVDDGGDAIAVWARRFSADAIVVEAAERPAGLAFQPAHTLSSESSGETSFSPAIGMAPDGRALVLWNHRIGSGPYEVQYRERGPDGVWTGTPEVASRPGEQARDAEVAVAPDGAAVATWRVTDAGADVLRIGVHPPGGAFTDFAPTASAIGGMRPVAGNRAGDIMVGWQSADFIFVVRRPAGGVFGGPEKVAPSSSLTPDLDTSLSLLDLAVDDEGNATALSRRWTSTRGTSFYGLETATFDAAPPRLDAVTVPSSGSAGAAIGMAATASDRVSTPAIAWAFGDGARAAGPTVSHTYPVPGTYTVTITATDVVGNSASVERPIVITRAPPPRVVSPVSARWGFRRGRVYLLRLRVDAVPVGATAQLRCAGHGCPFRRMSSSRVRDRAIVLFKDLVLRKAVAVKHRRLRPGQRLELRITAPGHVGEVVRYRLRRGKVPVTSVLCLPPGAATPQTTC
ncbi:PKD domain-containing protein [Solirubrobacter soli]|uniref:PKD domain-containing protein n=1 Tax=Solirubrobacter soli TaxID=363832 RepID=UPI000402573E|nr:PKD domain-containing protein [Solirubrobacter soli]